MLSKEASAAFDRITTPQLSTDDRRRVQIALDVAKHDLTGLTTPQTVVQAAGLIELWNSYDKDHELTVSEYIRWMVLFELRDQLSVKEFDAKKDSLAGDWPID